MKFIDFFAGIGGFHSGLERAGMKCVGWCEYDKFAQKSYRAIYDTEGLWFADDIRKVRGWDVPKADLWTFGFPCQDVSIAGKQKGIKRGTRSGLFYEIMRLIDEAQENRPEWLIAENVKNLLSIDGGRGFFAVLTEMGGARVLYRMANLQLKRLRSAAKPRTGLHCWTLWRADRTAVTTYPKRKYGSS